MRVSVLLVLAACSSSSSSSSTSSAPPSDTSDTTNHDGNDKPVVIVPGETKIGIGIDGDSFAGNGMDIGSLHVVAKVAAKTVVDQVLNGPGTPHLFEVTPPKDDPSALLEVSVVGRRQGATGEEDFDRIVTRTARAHFVPTQSKLLYLRLEVRCNTALVAGGGGPTGPRCDVPQQTCIGGACRDDLVADLPPLTPDWQTNPPSACGTGAPSLDLGLGQAAFEPVADGASVSLECGPQGGHHLWLAARASGLGQFGTIVTATATSGGVGVPATAWPYSFGAAAPGTCELPGLRFQLDASTSVDTFAGKPLDITLTAQDKTGKTATVTKHVNVASTFTGYCR